MKIVDKNKVVPTVQYKDIKAGECFKIGVDGTIWFKTYSNGAFQIYSGLACALMPSEKVIPVNTELHIVD